MDSSKQPIARLGIRPLLHGVSEEIDSGLNFRNSIVHILSLIPHVVPCTTRQI